MARTLRSTIAALLSTLILGAGLVATSAPATASTTPAGGDCYTISCSDTGHHGTHNHHGHSHGCLLYGLLCLGWGY
ncbi:hypothetical protein RIF23_16300 [Lipingzhangella sp. LS1_29]|uniref:DUF3761 domain-containing protein n=1 Tax=Lipingzhangella rawalii TaxID=2055835 RepID=A0ABU2H973_9ACTN|nr:hypothetical protein [Lipingzhangella rawalii]MDS1271856.1 hypothetical protein [Lipingzhangella rawalii]